MSRGNKQKGSLFYTLGMILCAGIFLVCAGLLAVRFWNDRQAQNSFDDLAAKIEQPEENTINTVKTATETGTPLSNAEKFAALTADNPDFIGWISIADTNLSFPVMYSPDNPNYYLRHDFTGAYSVYGVPYLSEDCTLTAENTSNNLIIYGHNMKTGTIFGSLTGYKKKDYYRQHPTITFDTLYGDGKYQVFAAFAIDVVKDTTFPYNTYTDMDEADFNQFVAEVIGRSDVDSGICPTYGDKLITLSTCEYSSDNGRYVVCARRMNAE